jgi:hypothetical protein
MSRGFQRLPSTATHRQRTTVLSTTTASIGHPSQGMNGGPSAQTSTMHETKSSACMLTIAG